MIVLLVLNENAFGEDFNLGTGEIHTWREVAACYTELIGARFIWVDTETYLTNATQNLPWNRIILCYDRLYDRRVDPVKVLNATNLGSQDFTSVRDALKSELKSALS